jgi:adenylate cyclase
MRSVFRLLAPYYKRAVLRDYNQSLRRLAWLLGEVRDLDVLIDNLTAFQKALPARRRRSLNDALATLDQERSNARVELVEALESRAHRRFLKDYSAFLLTPGAGVRSWSADLVVPIQVRHVLPGLIHDRLAAVQAYDTVLAAAEPPTLHALRIEFKRLRYAVSLFEPVLGESIHEFISAIKALQDCLGHLQDATAARERLERSLEIVEGSPLAAYIDSLTPHQDALMSELAELWAQFNSRNTQKKLSSALLALR